MEPVDKAVIDVLNKIRERAGMSRRAISRRSGIGHNRIGIIFRAEGPAPTVGEVVLIANVLGVTGAEVIGRAEMFLAGRDRGLCGDSLHGLNLGDDEGGVLNSDVKEEIEAPGWDE